MGTGNSLLFETQNLSPLHESTEPLCWTSLVINLGLLNYKHFDIFHLFYKLFMRDGLLLWDDGNILCDIFHICKHNCTDIEIISVSMENNNNYLIREKSKNRGILKKRMIQDVDIGLQ